MRDLTDANHAAPDASDLADEIHLASGGDQEAFGRLVARYRVKIFRWALATLGNADDADDATQRVLMKLHRHLRSFAGRSSFTTWLYRITRNTCIEQIRRRGPDTVPLDSLDIAATGPAERETLERMGARDAVRTLFVELPAQQRQIFDLADLQEIPQHQIAEMLDMNPSTVRAHLFKARRAMRSKILERMPELAEGYRS